ncbi:MAG: hypothetical protein EHM20_02055 [Alphaproteobacteria bacterium]|nr:MAG: hypothetical protein EHM20_02055 [Alphaproteobacteria bacterium]
MGRGNKIINKSMVKTIFEDNILIPLPKLLVGNRFRSLFSIISPTHCDFCGTKLNVNSHYTRFILTSYGTITRNTTWGNPNVRPMSRKLDKKQSWGKDLLSSFNRF